jgi:hypothetical protein
MTYASLQCDVSRFGAFGVAQLIVPKYDA